MTAPKPRRRVRRRPGEVLLPPPPLVIMEPAQRSCSHCGASAESNAMLAAHYRAVHAGGEQ